MTSPRPKPTERKKAAKVEGMRSLIGDGPYWGTSVQATAIHKVLADEAPRPPENCAWYCSACNHTHNMLESHGYGKCVERRAKPSDAAYLRDEVPLPDVSPFYYCELKKTVGCNGTAGPHGYGKCVERRKGERRKRNV